MLSGTKVEFREPPGIVTAGVQSDPDQVRSADYSILFVGNSHTSSHDLPKLVGEMIRFPHPEKTVYLRVVSVAFLAELPLDLQSARFALPTTARRS